MSYSKSYRDNRHRDNSDTRGARDHDKRKRKSLDSSHKDSNHSYSQGDSNCSNESLKKSRTDKREVYAPLGKDWNPNNKLLDKKFVENILEKFCGTHIRVYDLRKYQLAFVRIILFFKKYSFTYLPYVRCIKA